MSAEVTPRDASGGEVEPIRVLVVDDSFFLRKILTRLLEETPDLRVVDTARDGVEALEKVKALKPDVVTLDVEMPRLDGLATLRRLMAECPLPVVMLSAHTAHGTATALEALTLGAVDCVAKPSTGVGTELGRVKEELLEKIRVAARAHVDSLVREEAGALERLADTGRRGWARLLRAARPAGGERQAAFLVAVASSTGGPRTLTEFLAALTPGLPAAFLFVQHLSPGFTRPLARRLDAVGTLAVEEAAEGELLLEGRGYVAPGGRHLVVEGVPGSFRVGFRDGPPRHGVKPSADLLFLSVAECAGLRAAGVVLTGMGRDGAQGLKALRDAGGVTAVQDAASCVVYGMPRAAVEQGAAEFQGPVVEIARKIERWLAG